MNTLEKIVRHKINEVEYRKNFIKESELVTRLFFNREVVSLTKSLSKKAPGIIAEFKRKSPSKNNINIDANSVQITNNYQDNGAAAVSILTDNKFFKGHEKDILDARNNLSIPILRKEFIVDTYQILEAKSIGSDVILLIAEILSKTDLRELARFAKELKLEVLMEIHDITQLKKLTDDVDIIGVNNRDLTKFETDPMRSYELFPKLPTDRTLISESGIRDAQTIIKLRDRGFNGFLIGEYFMEAEDPGATLQKLISEVKG